MSVLKFDKNSVIEAPREFEVTLYGNIEAYSDALSKCRVRIFYKGLNRNRTYISEDFANQLIQSLPYTPLKGIFNKDDVDFEGHGDTNTDGRIYGIVMENPNFAWEQHEDSDGVVRSYACADVLLYTALYSEAKLIPGSSQSMEINPFTYEGEWKIWPEDGMPYYHFTKGSLFGLQVLGQSTEPCFEGAAFYYNYIKDELQPLIDYMKKIQKKEDDQMDKIEQSVPEVNLQSSSEEIEAKTENAVIEQEENAQDVPAIENNQEEIKEEEVESETDSKLNQDQTASVDNSVEGTTNEETVETKSGIEETVESTDVKQNETTEQEVQEEVNNEVVELKSQLAALQEEMDNLKNSYQAEKVRLEAEKQDLINERDNLLAFKNKQEKIEKEAILAKYSEHLSDEVIAKLTENIDTYSTEDFKKEVCTAAVENNPSIFSKDSEPEHYFYKNEDTTSKSLSGMERLLEKHKNGGSK